MKKEYIGADLEIIEINNQDIITESNEGPFMPNSNELNG